MKYDKKTIIQTEEYNNTNLSLRSPYGYNSLYENIIIFLQ